MKRYMVISTLIATALLIVGLGRLVIKNNSFLPDKIKKQLNYIIYTPTPSGDYKVDESTVKFDTDSRVLSLVATNTVNKLTLNQQATPDTFAETPIYPKLLEKLHQYQDMDTAIGKVTLTHPEELKGGQTAVSNNKGTLMFVRPDKDLTNEQWRTFFNSLEVVK